MKTRDKNEKSFNGDVTEQQITVRDNCPGGISELLATVLLTLSVTGFWYSCYYLLAPWIWRQNMHFQPEDLTPWIRNAVDKPDGVEIYALYIMVFVNCVTAFAFSGLIGHFAGKRIRNIIAALCAAASIIYCATIGFTPPTNSFQDALLSDIVVESLFIVLVFSPLIALLYYLQRRSPRWGVVTAALLLAPICFTAYSPISSLDDSYIFAPALRLLNGAAISDIYFQYDLLLSLLAAGWMKLGFDLNAFQILGRGAYYITLLGIFLFSRKLFQKKELTVFLLVALVLGRIYASPYDATVVFQVTPLRLDLWLPLLVLVYYRGPFHWSAALLCGFLMLVHKTFGIIYSIAYLQLIVTLLAIDYFDGKRRTPLMRSLLEYGKRCAVPVTILFLFSIASYFLFRNAEYGNYASYYQKIGIGFIRIAPTSFYWYVPALFSMVVILLFSLRKKAPSPYVTTGFLLTYCAIGNSIYFFGRSHEHNILNIAIVLLFLFFFMLDLIALFLGDDTGNQSEPSFLQKHGVVGVAVALIVVIIVSYSGNILKKGRVQTSNIKNADFIYPAELPENFKGYMAKIRAVTGNSSKVYFVDENDFIFYYYGGYAPVGFCNPFYSWIFTKDLNRFLQGLLDNGYYLVCSPSKKFLLANLRYNFDTVVGETVVVAKLNKQAPKP